MKRLYKLDPSTAESIKQRHHVLRLSQNALALATGLTEAAIAKYEMLRCPIPPEWLIAIEQALADTEKAGAAK